MKLSVQRGWRRLQRRTVHGTSMPGGSWRGFTMAAASASTPQSPPDSPLAAFMAHHSSGASLSTGYTHRFRGLGAGIDRAPAADFRMRCRDQLHTQQTSGVAPRFVQANPIGAGCLFCCQLPRPPQNSPVPIVPTPNRPSLRPQFSHPSLAANLHIPHQANMALLPKEDAFDFLLFFLRNPRACPLLAVTDPGIPCPHSVAPGSNLASDLPKYLVWRDGILTDVLPDVTHLCTDDTVGFLWGCSFSWEALLSEAGLAPRHIVEGKNVPMYRTHLMNERVGPFGGQMVVSMRPYLPHEISEAARLTAAFPAAHGAPVHWGDPAAIGLTDEKLSRPDWGDAVSMRQGELPVFWACGVTPQTALLEAKLPLVVTHAPGHMFVTDLIDDELKEDVVDHRT